MLTAVFYLPQELLLEDEAQSTAANINNNTHKIISGLGHMKANGTADTGVTIADVSAKWSPELQRDNLSNITIRVPEGKLCAVIGPVGSGKVRMSSDWTSLIGPPLWSSGHRQGKDVIGVEESYRTASVVYWSQFLVVDPEVSGSIPGATRFSE
jgi:ABC-type glutathione transport system ATPase component